MARCTIGVSGMTAQRRFAILVTTLTVSGAVFAGTSVVASYGLTRDTQGAVAYALALDPKRPRVTANQWSPELNIRAKEHIPGGNDGGQVDPASTSPWEYRLVEQRCSGDGNNFCIAYACGDPSQVGYLIERRLRTRREDGWESYSETCISPTEPEVTPGRILEELRRVGLPSMSVQAPPETFVNYKTIVYTEAETFTRTVNLLGFTVDIEATPSRFHWTYGDGTSESTTTAGRPYPAKDITHTWTDAHRTFHPSVDVTYSIRFRVDGGGWQTLGDTITIQGPEGDVRIREATGMLANMH